MVYKQVFSRQYAADSFGNRSIADAVALLSEGRLSIRIASGSDDVIDIGTHDVRLSTNVLFGDSAHESAQTPDERYSVEINTVRYGDTIEYWLVHLDQAKGEFKRAKLTSDYSDDPTRQPRVTVSPSGSYFLVDDSGTVRLYTSPHLVDAGPFQIA